MTPGDIYGFKYRAQNRQGFGEFSDPVLIKAADVPAQMIPVVITQEGLNIKLEWNVPDSGAQQILGYLVEVSNGHQEYFTLEECDGSDEQIRVNAWCHIQMASLITKGITQGTLIQARISAYNSLGFGIPSTLNVDGVLAQTIPHKPAAAPVRGESTSSSQIEVLYALLEGELTGGISLTSLNLQWDKGTEGVEWESLIGEDPLSTSQVFTVTDNLVGGRSYNFRYRARNIFGWGPFSDYGTILAAKEPDQLPPIVVE